MHAQKYSLKKAHRIKSLRFVLHISLLAAAIFFLLSHPPAMFKYRARAVEDEIGINFISSFSKHQDARVRALALLAISGHNFYDKQAISLIHAGLLDKDPLVQRAAKLVIEDNLGIRLKNGSEGTGQAEKLMKDAAPSALLIRKGIP